MLASVHAAECTLRVSAPVCCLLDFEFGQRLLPFMNAID